MYRSSLRVPVYGKKIKQEQFRQILTKTNTRKLNSQQNTNTYKKQHNQNSKNHHLNNLKQNNCHNMIKKPQIYDQKRILHQISSNKNIIHKNQENELMLSHNHKQLKTQSSVNDLSDIIYLDYSLKKNQEDLDIQIIDVYINNNGKQQGKYKNKDKKYENFYGNINSSNDKHQQNDDQEEFQILGISNYKLQQSCEDHKQQYYQQEYKLQQKSSQIPSQIYHKKRNSEHRSTAGLIRRNSKQIQQQQQQQHNIKEQVSNSNKQNKHRYYHKDQNQNQQINKKLSLCAHLLFKQIAHQNNSIKQSDIRKSSIHSDIKLILGPIISKFNLNKYKQLDQEQFIREFVILFNDFTVKETQEMIEKILQKEKGEQSYQKRQIQSDIKGDFKNYQQIYGGKDNNAVIMHDKSKNVVANDTRLKNLHSKVDSFLKRINKPSSIQNINEKPNTYTYTNTNIHNPSQHSKYSCQPSSSSFNHPPGYSFFAKQILMSQLSQIQQISHDSENMIQIQLSQNNQSNNSIKLNLQTRSNNSSICSFNRIGLQFNQLQKYINQ